MSEIRELPKLCTCEFCIFAEDCAKEDVEFDPNNFACDEVEWIK
jgi:hypothetical protein